MHKIKQITLREFKTRIRKKAFLITTILGPIMALSMMIVPLWLTGFSDHKEPEKFIINDPKNQYNLNVETFSESTIHFEKWNIDSASANAVFINSEIEMLIQLPDTSTSEAIIIKSKNGDFAKIETLKKLTSFLLLENTVSDKHHFRTTIVNHAQNGKKITELFAYLGPIMIYFFIFLYGMQVMKGVVEEKTNRIYEVLLCTVKPYQLLIGKIFGIALLSFVQFTIWGILNGLIIYLFESNYDLSIFADLNAIQQIENKDTLNFAIEMNYLLEGLKLVNLPFYFFSFFVYLIFGYFLYASLFAIVGSASDQDTETQQFIFPITMPLLIGFVSLGSVIADPTGIAAQILGYFPLTAPIIGMAKIPFLYEYPTILTETIVSWIILLLTCLFTIWFASRVYRVGIMTYGQKVGFRTLISWFFYK